MSTFQEVNDASLIELISKAQRRVIFVAPGVHTAVAEELGKRFAEIDQLQVTVVIDPDEDVCRIGYGDAKGLALLSDYATRQSFALMAQPGLRIGVLLVDDVTLVWSPTPRSIERPPLGVATTPTEGSPNGLLLGPNPIEQLAYAVSAAGTETLPLDAEIGIKVVTNDKVQETLNRLTKNPPIPVDLARITRVFSTKLQFAELTVKGANFSKRELKISNNHMNSDMGEQLREIVESKLRTFGALRDEEVEMPAFSNGEEVFDSNRNRKVEKITEASLQRQRSELERRYLFNISGFGRLIAKEDKQDLQRAVSAYETQLKAHSVGIRKRLSEHAEKFTNELIDTIIARSGRSDNKVNRAQLHGEIKKGLDQTKDVVPEVKLVFKDVTFEQTKDEAFRDKVGKALPAPKRTQLGNWSRQFDAAESVEGKV